MRLVQIKYLLKAVR